MNKTTFTRLIQNSTSISDADMFALEQVVLAFPYCHTAHMLLAKSSHDKGSMMAPQRLRKAAIHAPSRAILKKLIEAAPHRDRQEAYSQVLHPAAQATANLTTGIHSIVPEYNESIDDLIDNDFPETQAKEDQEQTGRIENSAPEAQILPFPAPANFTPEEPEFRKAEMAGAEAEEEPEAGIEQEAQTEAANLPANQPLADEPDKVERQDAVLSSSSETEINESIESTDPNTTATSSEILNENTEEETVTGEEKISIADETLEEPFAAIETPDSEDSDETKYSHVAEETNYAESDQHPGITQAEQKKQEDSSEKKNTYSQAAEPGNSAIAEEKPGTVASAPEIEEALPGLRDELILEQPVAGLPLLDAPEAKASSAESLFYSDDLIRSIFRESELGYTMMSSRLGECLQRKGELTTELPFHFQPELLVEYNHIKSIETEPQVDAAAAQHEIINDFLKQASKGRNRINQAAKAEEQEDLSSKSTKLNKSLVSENLAQIFAMQGKNKKAIKIYQQLMLKIPEKKDYFASQIVKLQNNAS